MNSISWFQRLNTLEKSILAIGIFGIVCSGVVGMRSGIEQLKPPVYSIKGSFELIDENIEGGSEEPGSQCYGTGGFNDISAGMPVTIRDEKGLIIATGDTTEGTRPVEHPSVTCIFGFKIEGIPKANFYTIEIGRRGNLNYSFEDMNKRNWEVSLRLASP